MLQTIIFSIGLWNKKPEFQTSPLGTITIQIPLSNQLLQEKGQWSWRHIVSIYLKNWSQRKGSPSWKSLNPPSTTNLTEKDWFKGPNHKTWLFTLHQVLIYGTHVFLNLVKLWRCLRTKIASKLPYYISIENLRIKLLEL